MDLQALFAAQVEATIQEAGEFGGRARPALEEIAQLSADAMAARMRGEVWEAVEASLESALHRLEVAGMIAIKIAWKRRMTTLLSGVAQALIGAIPQFPPLPA